MHAASPRQPDSRRGSPSALRYAPAGHPTALLLGGGTHLRGDAASAAACAWRTRVVSPPGTGQPAARRREAAAVPGTVAHFHFLSGVFLRCTVSCLVQLSSAQLCCVASACLPQHSSFPAPRRRPPARCRPHGAAGGGSLPAPRPATCRVAERAAGRCGQGSSAPRLQPSHPTPGTAASPSPIPVSHGGSPDP